MTVIAILVIFTLTMLLIKEKGKSAENLAMYEDATEKYENLQNLIHKCGINIDSNYNVTISKAGN